jgi:hypothetical protein
LSLLWKRRTMRRNWIIGKGNGIEPLGVVFLVIIINERWVTLFVLCDGADISAIENDLVDDVRLSAW